MKRTKFQFAAIAALIVLPSAAFAQNSRAVSNPTALDRYVAKPDSNYGYDFVRTIEGEGFMGYVLDLTSQDWRGAGPAVPNLWRHWLTIVVPDERKDGIGLLYIGGGKNGIEAPGEVRERLRLLALGTGTVVAEVLMVPNQPITFLDERKPRSEDAFIAYTWDRYLRTGAEEAPARLPMTKAAVRAMDAVQHFCKTALDQPVAVEKFVVAGGSKRGWASWTTAAVDTRVVGVMPLVIDLLNRLKNYEHQFSVYGFWAPAIHDYVDMGIMDWFGSKEFDSLMEVVDPYSYRSRYTMPKYLIHSTGDQYMIPDSSRHYYDGLPGPKYLRYIPNTQHNLAGSDVGQSMLSFYNAVVNKLPLPDYSWQFLDEGLIQVKTGVEPLSVKVWHATNPDARDFRLQTIGEAWTSAEIPLASENVYVARTEEPEKGWSAYLVELRFASPIEDAPYTFTTGVRVVPGAFPHQYETPKEHPRGFLSR